ncbi:MAG TPA: mechanosensitive ion channel protein MscS [Chryseobacterium sp.]|nr:mechanosensitive ion channel protein MscS [Chryseobacterium sp.]
MFCWPSDFGYRIFLAKQLRNLAHRKVDKYLKHRALGELLLNLIYVFAIGVVIFTALRVLKLDKTVTTALAGAGIAGIALAFAFQDIAANFISGIFLTFQRPFFIREAIRIKDLEGFVQDMSLRDTTLKTYQGQLIVIPNKEVFQNAITNYTWLGKRRADITGTLEATVDLKKVQQVALTALHDIPGVIAADTLFLYENICEGTVNFKAMVWLNSGERIAYLEFVSHFIIAITDAFKRNGIALP